MLGDAAAAYPGLINKKDIRGIKVTDFHKHMRYVDITMEKRVVEVSVIC
jgi:hypothetical protein